MTRSSHVMVRSPMARGPKRRVTRFTSRRSTDGMSNLFDVESAAESTSEDASITLWFPFLPDPVLSPNSTAHWRVKASAKAQLRRDSSLVASSQLLASSVLPDVLLPREREVDIEIEILLGPRRKRMDSDNALASLKALLDGVADAFQRDDASFRPFPPQQRRVHPEGTPGVLLTMRPGDPLAF